jgi:glycosyltransferase involved in cell wall biosynthesis
VSGSQTPFSSLAVVVPVLDEVGEITACLRHLARMLPGSTIVVADGGSRDGTLEAITSLLSRRYQRTLDSVLGGVRIHVVEAPRGRGPQLASGAVRALEGEGVETLLFLHVDTALTAEAVAGMAAALDDPGFGWGWFDLRLDGPSRWERWIERSISLKARLTGRPRGSQGLLVSSRNYLAAGGYAPLPIFEDVELVGRLRKRARGRRVGGAVVSSGRHYRWGGHLPTTLRRLEMGMRYRWGASAEELSNRYQEDRFRPPDRK